MRTIIALIALLIVLPAHAVAQWQHEPPGSRVLLDCRWDHPTCNDALTDPYHSAFNSVTIVQDPSAPVSPSNVGNSKLVYPSNTGGTELHYTAPQEIRNVYVAIIWRPSNPFGGNRPGLNKLFFIRRKTLDSNGVFMWTYRFSDTIEGNGNLGEIHFNTQTPYTNTDRCGVDGLVCRANAGVSKRIFPGDGWHKLEAQFTGGSCRTCPDGTLTWWIDGELQGYYPNFVYTTVPDNIVWSETWDGPTGGNGYVPDGYTSDQSHNWDHWHISTTDNVVGTDNPPGPPSAPILSTVQVIE